MSELKPCPFCGGEAKFVHIFENPEKCMVSCRECDGGIDAVFANEEAANEAWNRRAQPAEPPVRCGECANYQTQNCAAADLIESMQAQLTESQRREKAAVEDWKIYEENGQCDVCKYGEGGGCAYPEGNRCRFDWLRQPAEEETT